MEKHEFKSESKRLLDLMINSIYTNKDIFLRELISNASDALDKLYYRSLTDKDVKVKREDLGILLEKDDEKRTLTISDNGCGMTKEELENNLGTIAKSGTLAFKENMSKEEKTNIIGQFGVGFYSAFMVAKKVQIDTLSYKKEATPVRWICEGGTEYEMGDSDSRETRGTTITLFLDDESKEFLEYYKVRGIIEKYCSFLPTEIFLINVDEEKKKSEEDKDKDGEPTPLNDTNPLWLKKPSECTDEEYKEFYKQVFNEYEDPLFWIHLNVDYPFNLKGILYFPKLKNEFELIEGKVKLYNNQVFVADNIKEVIPEFLLLLKGAIDCPDLPLNVSRSFLQNDRDVSRISKHIVKKVADKLNSIFNNDRDKFDEFWDDIHLFIKFGCLKDESFYEKIKDIIVFKNIEGKHITLKDYLENAKEKHENKVFYVSNEEEQSQYIKLFKEYELDALILSSPIDNNFISFLEYKDGNVKFTRVDSDLSDVLKDKDAEEDKENNEKIIELFKSVIGDKMKEYKVESLKNEKTPAMVLLSEYSRRMAEMQAQFGGMGMNIPEEKSLVINGNNPIIKKLASISDDESKKDKVNIICKQIVDLALISNKSLNSDELDEFINRTNDLMLQVMDI